MALTTFGLHHQTDREKSHRLVPNVVKYCKKFVRLGFFLLFSVGLAFLILHKTEKYTNEFGQVTNRIFHPMASVDFAVDRNGSSFFFLRLLFYWTESF